MTNQPPDPDLRELFQELRARDERRAPGFREMLAGARQEALEGKTGEDMEWHRGRRIRRRVAWGGSLLAAAAAAIVLLLPGRGTSEAAFERAVRSYSASSAGGAWRSPTDALLDLPGSEVLTTLPRVGGRRWPSSPGGNPRTNQL
jgi:ferric-dicitrate binding protein FerR (iron transport regulator)